MFNTNLIIPSSYGHIVFAYSKKITIISIRNRPDFTVLVNDIGYLFLLFQMDFRCTFRALTAIGPILAELVPFLRKSSPVIDFYVDSFVAYLMIWSIIRTTLIVIACVIASEVGLVNRVRKVKICVDVEKLKSGTVIVSRQLIFSSSMFSKLYLIVINGCR